MPSCRRSLPPGNSLSSPKPDAGSSSSSSSSSSSGLGDVPLLNSRQEAFCRAYVSGMEGRWAALRAGYAPRSAVNQAYRLLCKPAVKARIRVLRAAVAREACSDIADVVAKLEAIYYRALDLGDHAAAARIVAMQARFSGIGQGDK